MLENREEPAPGIGLADSLCVCRLEPPEDGKREGWETDRWRIREGMAETERA